MSNRMNKLDSIISESIDKFLLREFYHGKLYHYTSLPLLVSILNDDCLCISDCSDSYGYDRRGTITKDYEELGYVSLTRDKHYNIRNGYSIICRLEFDADKLMSIRGAKLYPINFSGKAKIGKTNEAEERLFVPGHYGIYPLHEYVDRIDVIVNGYDRLSDGGTDIEDKLYDIVVKANTGLDEVEVYKKMVGYLLKSISSHSLFKDKLHIEYK